MHQAAVAYRGQQGGEGHVEPQDAGSQINFSQGYRLTRAKRDVIENAAIFTQRDFATGAPVQIVKNWPRKPLLGQRPEIVNTDDMGRCDFTCRSGHWLFRTAAAPKHAIIQKNHVGTDGDICPGVVSGW
jgi:hypothetical protein